MTVILKHWLAQQVLATVVHERVAATGLIFWLNSFSDIEAIPMCVI